MGVEGEAEELFKAAVGGGGAPPRPRWDFLLVELRSSTRQSTSSCR